MSPNVSNTKEEEEGQKSQLLLFTILVNAMSLFSNARLSLGAIAPRAHLYNIQSSGNRRNKSETRHLTHTLLAANQ